MSRARQLLDEVVSLPSVGDVINLTTGTSARVVAIDLFSELKSKYPRAAQRAISNAQEQGIPEERLGRAWAIEDEQGEVYLVGSSALRLFIKEGSIYDDTRCSDCGMETNHLRSPPGSAEWYMVKDPVWAAATRTAYRREKVPNFLCVGCLEKRLGRKLTPADFSDVPLNDPGPGTSEGYERSPRLRSRMGLLNKWNVDFVEA